MDETNRQLMKPRVHQQLVEALARAILRGDFTSGTLPPEPQLCETYQISRSALREAVRVLTGKGLVTPRPHVGTAIRPREDWNMLDPDLLAWSTDGEPDAQMLKGLIEARQVIEPAAARFAAERAAAADLAVIERAFLGMSAAREAQDFDGYIEADRDFHTAILRASHNFVFQQLATTISAALTFFFRVTPRDLGRALPLHGEIMELIRVRDAKGAEAAMARLLDVALDDVRHHRPDVTG
jgi:GntR family galactonate operon transcriptional repressor